MRSTRAFPGASAASAQYVKIGQLTGAAADLCRILARRHWHRGADGKLLIENQDDLNIITGQQQRIQSLAADIDQHRDAAVERARQSLKELPES